MKIKMKILSVFCAIIIATVTLPVSAVDTTSDIASGTTTAQDTSPFVIDSTGTLTKYNGTETTIVIPDTVKKIADYAFEYNRTVKEVSIPDTVTEIGYGVFWGCWELEKVTLPQTITSINYGTFGGCKKLTSITIPNTVTNIGSLAFNNCASLCDIYISDKVNMIGEQVFNGCSSLTEINVSENNANYASIDGVLFNKAKTVLIKVPETLTAYEIPTTVSTIGQFAFYECTKLSSITVPLSVTTIEKCAFKYCSIKSISLPDSITSIGNCAFEFCTALNDISIPSKVKTISYCVFEYCTALKNVTIPENVSTIEDSAFASCSSLECVTVPASVTSMGTYVFYDCDKLRHATILANITVIPYATFYCCSGPLFVEFKGENLETIDDYALPSKCKFAVASPSTAVADYCKLHKIYVNPISGDINYDNSISVADIVLLECQITQYKYTDVTALSDVNQDSVINSLDVASLKTILLTAK